MKIQRLVFLMAVLALPLSARAEMIWDCETVEVTAKSGEAEARGKFSFTNSGQRTVVIHGIRTCCTCLVGTSSEDEVLPGKKGEIEFVFKLQGRVGKQKRQLLVLHNDPVEPRTVLNIVVNIE